MKRPTGITIIGIIEIIAGFGGLIGGICAALNLLIVGITAGTLVVAGQTGSVVTAGNIFTAVGIFLLVIILAFAIVVIGGLQFFVGVGLLGLQTWARALAIFVAVVALIFSVLGLLMTLFGGVPRGTDATTTIATFTIQIILQAIVLWYMYRPNVKEAFGRGGPEASPTGS